MRVKCANCGMVYDIHPSSMEFRTEQEVLQLGQCPGCKSNAKDTIENNAWQEYNNNFRSSQKTE